MLIVYQKIMVVILIEKNWIFKVFYSPKETMTRSQHKAIADQRTTAEKFLLINQRNLRKMISIQRCMNQTMLLFILFFKYF